VRGRARCRRRTSSWTLLAELAVERAQRLVHQEYVRLDDEGAGEGDALLLPAGELADHALGETVEPDQAQRLAHPPLQLGARDAAHAQPVGDVLEDIHVREEGVVLEYHPHVAAARRQFGDVATADMQPPGGGFQIPGADVEDRRLARARGTEQGKELALGDGKIGRRQRRYRAE